MSGFGSNSHSRHSRRRELIEVLEPRVRDKSIDKLLVVQKQRMDRLERDKLLARQTWRQERVALNNKKLEWRQQLKDAAQYWQDIRAAFFRMEITSGQFRAGKATFERMTGEAAKMREEAKEFATKARQAGRDFFNARQVLIDARKREEKLGMLRDEMQRALALPEY